MIFLCVVLVMLVVNSIIFAYDKYWWSFCILLASVGLLWPSKPMQEIISTYGIYTICLYGLPIYLGIGACVACMKWLLFTTSIANTIEHHKYQFNQQYIPTYDKSNTPNVDQLAAIKRDKFITYLRNIGLQTITKYPSQYSRPHHIPDTNTIDYLLYVLTPTAPNYIPRITRWILQWPVVIVATMLQDIIMKFSHWVSTLIETLFGKFARYQMSKAVKGL